MNDEMGQCRDSRFEMPATERDLEIAVESFAVMVQTGLSALGEQLVSNERGNALSVAALESRVRKPEEHVLE